MTNMFDPYKYPNCIDLDVKCEHEFLTIRENYSRTDWVPEAYHGQKGKVIKSVFPKAFITGSASFLLEFENEERMWISSLSVQEYMFPWEKKENDSRHLHHSFLLLGTNYYYEACNGKLELIS